MQNIQWTTVPKQVNELIPQTINPRKISDKQMSDLKKSLQKFNLAEIPVINLDGGILSGHQRIKALQLLGRGEEFIDVRIPNRQLDKAEADQYLIGANALGGTWDFEALHTHFDFQSLTDFGFDPLELSKEWNTYTEVTGDTFDVEQELKQITVPYTKRGDIILLGKHKIICGDSTDPQTLTKLFNREKTSFIYSDPIYNIGVDYDKGIGGNQAYGGTTDDNKSYSEYRTFLKLSMIAALTVAHADTHVFYWSDQTYIGLVQELYRELGITNKRVCLWIKNGSYPTPGVAFSKCYEPCTYGTRGKPYLAEGMNNYNEIANKETTNGNQLLGDIEDIWTHKRLSAQEYEHSTSKPAELHQKAILRCTKPNDIILDSFLGSGSTLIAGEQLGRRVYGVEIEPTFCDLIIRRFEKLTGMKAQIIHADETETT